MFEGKTVSKVYMMDEYFYDTSIIHSPYSSDTDVILGTQTVNFKDKISIKNAVGMFEGFGNLCRIDNSKNLDISGVSAIRHMFSLCANLTDVDIFKQPFQVDSLEGVFRYCEKLRQIDISGLTTNSLIQSMRSTFSNCSSLVTIYVKHFKLEDTPEALDNTFENCVNLIGGHGTKFGGHIGKEYARIDNPPNEPGYFTRKIEVVDVYPHELVAPIYDALGNDVSNRLGVVDDEELELYFDYYIDAKNSLITNPSKGFYDIVDIDEECDTLIDVTNIVSMVPLQDFRLPITVNIKIPDMVHEPKIQCVTYDVYDNGYYTAFKTKVGYVGDGTVSFACTHIMNV